MPEKTTFNVDNVRVCKIVGSGLASSQVFQGMVFRRSVESTIIKKENAKVTILQNSLKTLSIEIL